LLSFDNQATSSPLRRNVSKVLKEERNTFRDTVISLNTPEFSFHGNRGDKPFVGGVSFWFKQDEIHQATHVHHGPAFLPWHRELLNRFEKLLKSSNDKVSLHYWDWNEDPENTVDIEGHSLNLFKSEFMGNAVER